MAEESCRSDQLAVFEGAQDKIIEAGNIETRGHCFDRRSAMFVHRFAEGLRILMECLQSELPESAGVVRTEDTDHLRLGYTLREHACDCENN